ncbi:MULTISPECIES: pyrroloquinoline quinone precursor peptide PqqA [Paraburkholderia]|uniref:pyrroloquinoline quinone precursor peptide PqqA n=1 Tax=Paraburkholderia TaxID=1822464 RepID=UPI00344CED3F
MEHFASFSPHRAACHVEWLAQVSRWRNSADAVLIGCSCAGSPVRCNRQAWSLRHAGCRQGRACRSACGATLFQLMEEARMQWTTPSYVDVRLGFEIVMYVATR